jgi:hypothetical protein
MGLKSGSRDAGLDETADEEAEPDEEAASPDHEDTVTDSDTGRSETVDATARSDTGEQRPTMDSIPYKLRRNKVNEGREQVPYFLRAEVIEAEDGLQETLERALGEKVYKSDYREAAMVVAQRNPELVAAVLREWGYDLD